MTDARDAAEEQHVPIHQPEQEIVEDDALEQDINPDFYPSMTIADQFAMLSRMPEQTILAWKGPSRPYKERNKQYFTTIAMIVFLLCIILFFAGNFMSVGVVLAFAFFAYVLASVPPETVGYAITTHGLRVEDKLYPWLSVGRFWFTKRFHYTLLQVEYASRYVDRITFVLQDVTEQDVSEVLSQFLLHEKPLPTFLDKAATWMQKNVPLE